MKSRFIIKILFTLLFFNKSYSKEIMIYTPLFPLEEGARVIIETQQMLGDDHNFKIKKNIGQLDFFISNIKQEDFNFIVNAEITKELFSNISSKLDNKYIINNNFSSEFRNYIENNKKQLTPFIVWLLNSFAIDYDNSISTKNFKSLISKLRLGSQKTTLSERKLLRKIAMNYNLYLKVKSKSLDEQKIIVKIKLNQVIKKIIMSLRNYYTIISSFDSRTKMIHDSELKRFNLKTIQINASNTDRITQILNKTDSLINQNNDSKKIFSYNPPKSLPAPTNDWLPKDDYVGPDTLPFPINDWIDEDRDLNSKQISQLNKSKEKNNTQVVDPDSEWILDE